jgi:hypothetical protein
LKKRKAVKRGRAWEGRGVEVSTEYTAGIGRLGKKWRKTGRRKCNWGKRMGERGEKRGRVEDGRELDSRIGRDEQGEEKEDKGL